MTVRVLSLDGGGVRGILPARVLAELEAITGTRVADLFDLIAGTATGAVLALGLAAPGMGGRPRFRAEQLLDFYLNDGHALFPRPDATHRLAHLISLRRARHPARRPLAERFGETSLGDALVDVIVPTFDLGGADPLLLRSSEFSPGLGPLMRDVALASSSVPTHFPTIGIELGARVSWLTHGGLVANNPAPLAYAAALAKATPDEIVLVSLGSGARAAERSNGMPRRAPRWPLGAARSFELQLESTGEAQHQMLDALLAATGQRERYWRLQPALRPHSHHDGLTDSHAVSLLADEFVVSARPSLVQIADAVT